MVATLPQRRGTRRGITVFVKNHPFTDGNKRIGSLLFVHYLDKNGRLLRDDGTARFDSNALVALALLVAGSDPKQRDLVIRLILAMLSH